MSLLIKGILINLLLLTVIMPVAWGLSGATLIGLSASGQTALFNFGVHDGAKEGDYAVVVKEIHTSSSQGIRLVPVAKARNIKINTQNSIWILYKLYDPELVVKGQNYLILTESMMLSGRRDPRFGRISVITKKDKAALQTKQALADDKDRLSKLKHQYPELTELHEKELRSDNDGDLLDVEEWNKIKNSNHRSSLYKGPHTKEFKRELRLSTFEKMVTAYLLRVNDPKFNYDDFYEDQKKVKYSNEFKQRSSFSTEYSDFVHNQSQKTQDDAKLYRSLLDKGEGWSEDFSDEELRSILGQVSILREKDRRAYVGANPNRYALFLNYGMSFTDSQTEKDPGYRRQGRYSIDVNFETVPFVRHEKLERFTLDAGVRSNKTAFSTSNTNASLDELSINAGVNWYPIYAPYIIEAPVMFLGVFVRNGRGNVSAPSISETSKYTILSMPGLRGGMRYNFKNNLGLRLALSMETLNLDRYEQSQLSAVLPDQTTVSEAKMNFAMSYSF